MWTTFVSFAQAIHNKIIFIVLSSVSGEKQAGTESFASFARASPSSSSSSSSGIYWSKFLITSDFIMKIGGT